MSRKVDGTGRYLRFRGTTVVAAAEAGAATWVSLHATLCAMPQITDHYSLLPVDSYHLTTMSLFHERSPNGGLQVASEQHEPPRSWEALLEDQLDWLRRLESEGIRTESAPLEGTIAEPIVGGVIMIAVDLGAEATARIRDQASRWGVTQRFPAAVPDPFHVTLGYMYRRPPDDGWDVLSGAVHTAMAAAVPSAQARRVRFDAPRLCYFNDMTKFIPWDASSNPFG